MTLLECGVIRRRHARAIVASLPRQIADRELAVVRDRLGWSDAELETCVVEASGPGNALLLEVASEHVTELVSSFGEIGVRAETVAEQAAKEVRDYLAAGVAVGHHLADQLMLPMALAGGGAFRTIGLSLHSRTNLDVIRMFLPVRMTVRGRRDDVVVDICS